MQPYKRFCPNCGKKLVSNREKCIYCGKRYDLQDKNIPALGAGGVGWSDKASDPFFKNYAINYMGCSAVFTIILSLVVVTALVATKEVNPKGEEAYVLVVVPAIFFIFGIVFFIKRHGFKGGVYEAVVENKTIEHKKRRKRETIGGTRRYYTEEYTEYTVVFRLKNGKARYLTLENDSSEYKRYKIGELVRMYETRFVKYIEKYDKTHEKELQCAACPFFSDPRADFCIYCGAPMLKGKLTLQQSELDEYGTLNKSTPKIKERTKQDKIKCYCANCGCAILIDEDFCPECGEKAYNKDAKEEAAKDVKEDISEDISKDVRKDISEDVSENLKDNSAANKIDMAKAQCYCTNCGRALMSGDVFCPKCGERVGAEDIKDEDDNANAAKNAQAHSGGFCSNCGCKLMPGDVFCVECGEMVLDNE